MRCECVEDGKKATSMYQSNASTMSVFLTIIPVVIMQKSIYMVLCILREQSIITVHVRTPHEDLVTSCLHYRLLGVQATPCHHKPFVGLAMFFQFHMGPGQGSYDPH